MIENNTKILIEKCEQTLGGGADEAVKVRLQKEIDLLIKYGYVNEVLLALDLFEYAESAGLEITLREPWQCSLVCYLLKLTSIDPVFFNLPYERCFVSCSEKHRCLNFDIAEGTLDSFLVHLKTKYGEGNVGRAICTEGGENHVNGTAVLIAPSRAENVPHTVIDGKDVIAIPLTEALDEGFLQVNLLPMHGLNVLKNVRDLVKERYGRDVKFDCHNLSDKATLRIFANGNTGDICGFNAKIVQKAIKSIHRPTFANLVDMVALLRPGYDKTIPTYVKFYNGTGLTTCVYQEDLINAALAYGMGIDNELFKKILKSGAFCKACALYYAFAAYKLAYYKAYYPKEYSLAL